MVMADSHFSTLTNHCRFDVDYDTGAEENIDITKACCDHFENSNTSRVKWSGGWNAKVRTK
jgi:hypothetical protein